MLRVLIADDHVTVLEGLAAIIGRQPDMCVVAQASDGAMAVALWQQHRPDLALFDLRGCSCAIFAFLFLLSLFFRMEIN